MVLFPKTSDSDISNGLVGVSHTGRKGTLVVSDCYLYIMNVDFTTATDLTNGYVIAYLNDTSLLQI